MKHQDLALLSRWATYSDLSRTFRDIVSIPSSRVKMSSWTSWALKMGTIWCPETSVTNRPTPFKIQRKKYLSVVDIFVPRFFLRSSSNRLYFLPRLTFSSTLPSILSSKTCLMNFPSIYCMEDNMLFLDSVY